MPNFLSAVSIAYLREIVNHLLPKRKNWCAVDERKHLAEKRKKLKLMQPTDKHRITTQKLHRCKQRKKRCHCSNACGGTWGFEPHWGPLLCFWSISHYFYNLLRCQATPQVEIPRMPINMMWNNFMKFSPLSSISIVSPFANSLLSFIENTDNKVAMETIKGYFKGLL